jgi:DNA-binding SARP family transcriptional activator
VTPDEAVTPFSIWLFGPFEVRLGGQPLPHLKFRKSQATLALLAIRQGREMERDCLAGLLWPDSAPSSALHSLRNCLTDLRHALGPEAGRLRSPTSRTLCLDLTSASVDVVAFDAALARGDPVALEEAVSLYRGPLLEGCAEAWAFQERQVREQAYLDARERLAALALARGDAPTGERHLRSVVTADGLRESAHRSLMEVLAAGGNYAAVLLAYRELRLRLHRELNAEPDPETRALFRRLQAEARRLQDRPSAGTHPGLPSAPGPAPRVSPAPRRPRVVLRSSALTPPAIADGGSASPDAGDIRAPTGGENRLVTVLFAGPPTSWVPGRSVEATQGLHPEEAAALVSRLLAVMVDAILKFGGARGSLPGGRAAGALRNASGSRG